MVCVAAFIILVLVGVFVAFLSLFRKDIGKKYWAVFKKAWGCVGKKVRLQKCETNFKDDVKNAMLGRVVLKHPGWIKPLGAAIEVSAILIVLITVWSLVEAVKALLALWVFGTCNVSQPASCALGAEVCGIDAEEPKNPLEWTGRWIGEWGEIFAAVPERFRDWQAEEFLVEPLAFAKTYHEGAALALEVFDPGCVVCMQSYRNMRATGFLEKYNVVMMIYPIRLPDGTEKFQNSELFARYFHAANLAETNYAAKMVERLFTASNSAGINYQTYFKSLEPEAAEQLLLSWLEDFGAEAQQVERIRELAGGAAVAELMESVRQTVEERIHAKGIPTLIYDGMRSSGLYAAK